MASSVYPYDHTEIRSYQITGPTPEALLVRASGGAADGECPGHAFLGVSGDRAQVAVCPGRTGGEGERSGGHARGGGGCPRTPMPGRGTPGARASTASTTTGALSRRRRGAG